MRIVPCNIPFKRPLKSWRPGKELLGDILRPRKTSDVQNVLQYYLFNVVGSVMTDVSVSRKPIESSTCWAFSIKSGCYITLSPYLPQNVMPLKRFLFVCFLFCVRPAVSRGSKAPPKVRQLDRQRESGKKRRNQAIQVHKCACLTFSLLF